MKSSLENVSRHFYAFLDRRDVRVLREYYSDADGGFVVDATLPEFRMRFVKSEGGFNLLVGSKSGGEWHALHQVLQQMTHASVPNDPEILTNYLLDQYDQLCVVLNNSGFATT